MSRVKAAQWRAPAARAPRMCPGPPPRGHPTAGGISSGAAPDSRSPNRPVSALPPLNTTQTRSPSRIGISPKRTNLEGAALLEVLRLGVDPAVGDTKTARRQHPRRRRRGENGRAIDAPVQNAAGFMESFERDDMVGHGGNMARPEQIDATRGAPRASIQVEGNRRRQFGASTRRECEGR
jgi:hypothetical protein